MTVAIVPLGYALSFVLGLLAGLHAYWALGGEWGLRAALGGNETPPRAVIWALVVALSLAALVVLGRIGVWGAGLPSWIFGYGTWAIAGAFALAGLGNLAGRTTLERVGFAPFCLLLAALLVVAARSRVVQ